MAIARQQVVPAFLVSPAVLSSCLFVLLPVVCIGAYSFWGHMVAGAVEKTLTLENWRELVKDPFYGSILLRTVRLAATTTVLAVLIGYGPAYYLSTIPAKKRGILVLMLFLPSWISYIVRTMSWIQILGRNGLVNTALQGLGITNEPIKLLYNDFAIYVGILQYVLPIMILNIYLGLTSVDRNVVDAARTLGANGPQAFFRVTVPLSMGGLSAGCLICFIWTLGSFVTPMLLGGPGTTYYATLVYENILTQQDWPFGSTLALLSVLFLTVSLAVYGRLMGLSHMFRETR